MRHHYILEEHGEHVGNHQFGVVSGNISLAPDDIQEVPVEFPLSQLWETTKPLYPLLPVLWYVLPAKHASQIGPLMSLPSRRKQNSMLTLHVSTHFTLYVCDYAIVCVLQSQISFKKLRGSSSTSLPLSSQQIKRDLEERKIFFSSFQCVSKYPHMISDLDLKA